MKPNYDDYLQYERNPVNNPRDPWDAFQAGWNACLACLEAIQGHAINVCPVGGEHEWPTKTGEIYTGVCHKCGKHR